MSLVESQVRSPAAAGLDRRRLPDPFEALNDEQRTAVEHGIDAACRGPQVGDPLLVIAGAGSGKTLMLASRVARLVMMGTDPQRLLLLTFSRRAALELERRAGRMLHRALGLAPAQRAPSLPWAGTFHAVGARLLRELAPRIGLPADFTIDDRPDAEDLLGALRIDLGLAASRQRFPSKSACLAIYSRAVNTAAPLADVLKAAFPWCAAWHDDLKRLFGAYAAEKARQHVLDYDDLLLWWAEVLRDPALARELGARFDHVLVDEYQDTNRLQAAILLGLKPDGRGVTVVGDDAQAIYGFRGAEVRNILDFPRAFARPARIVTLERNYRSVQPVLDAANGVIGLAAERHAKALRATHAGGDRPSIVRVADEAEQAAWVADEVLRQREAGIVLKRQAVLMRAAQHGAALELELARRGIPFVKYGGLKFLETAHVRDVLAVLRLAQNPRSRAAALRASTLVPGIGPAHARRLADVLEAAPDPAAALLGFRAPAAAIEPWTAFAALFASLRDASSIWPAELERVAAWYRPQLERLHEDAAARAADLAQLVHLAAAHPSRERFLTELTLDPPAAASDEAGAPLLDDDWLVLSTIHSAKGQEWSVVFLLNAVDGCIPSDMAAGSAGEVEEERRLLYVAMTRARTHLHLLVPQRFYVHQQPAGGDRYVHAMLTRFIPDALLERFVQRAPFALPASMVPHAAAAPAVDLGARIRARWG
jgi:DNA helicase-2/ATP-dependent DNA helicase PcrA